MVQLAADVGPTKPNDTWICTIDRRRFIARFLRPWHVAVYNRRRARGAAEAQWFARRFPTRPDLASRRVTASHRIGLHFLLRQAFPWRVSYVLRGDPVRLVLALPPVEQGATLADLLAHVRPPAQPTLRDRLGARLFPPPKVPTNG